MIEIKCRCGKSKKNFKNNIGEFYVDDCCIEAGYDELGNLVKKDLDLTGLPSQEELDKLAADLKEDKSPEPTDPTEETLTEEENKVLNSNQLVTEVTPKEGETLTDAITRTDDQTEKELKALKKKADKEAKEAAKKAKENQSK